MDGPIDNFLQKYSEIFWTEKHFFLPSLFFIEVSNQVDLGMIMFVIIRI